MKKLPFSTRFPLRTAAAYVLPLILALSHAYVAYRVDVLARLMDVSCRCATNLPITLIRTGRGIGLIVAFPGQQVGVDLAAVLLLFTPMSQNMLLGLYQSLCGFPRDLVDGAREL